MWSDGTLDQLQTVDYEPVAPTQQRNTRKKRNSTKFRRLPVLRSKRKSRQDELAFETVSSSVADAPLGTPMVDLLQYKDPSGNLNPIGKEIDSIQQSLQLLNITKAKNTKSQSSGQGIGKSTPAPQPQANTEEVLEELKTRLLAINKELNKQYKS